jgi:putative transcriptional regulator
MPVVINLDVLLAKRKWSLTELSAKSGISMASLSTLKTGRARGIRLRTLSRICRALECDAADLFEIVDEATYRKLFHRDWDDSDDDE